MRRTTIDPRAPLVAALLLASCATTGTTGTKGTWSDDAVTFGTRPQKKGDVDASTQSISSQMRAVASSGGTTLAVTNMDRKAHKRVTTTVLAVKNGAATALRLHFLESTKTDAVDGKAGPPTVSPVSGKTYVVRRVNGKVEVASDDGGAVPEAEAKIVRDEVGALDQPDPMDAFMASHTFKKGVPVAVPDKLVTQTLGGGSDDSMRFGGMTLVLKRVLFKKSGVYAVLATSFEMSAPIAKGATITGRMKGTFIVDVASGRVLSGSFSGPVQMSGSVHHGDAVIDIKGTGTMSVTGTDVYK